jgi:diaminohydroxyphosphoribosylaminopyrimidine deaminase/5-amino-6-(5-phosphoribosylamino)uracil reductase
MAAPEEAEFRLLPLGVEVLRSPDSTDPLDLKDALGFLSAKGITRLMLEGGPTLAAAFIADDLIDEAVLFHSDKVVGPGGIEALDTAALAMLKQRLEAVTTEVVGADRQQTYQRR